MNCRTSLLLVGALVWPALSEGAVVTYVAMGHVTLISQRDSQFPTELAGVAVGDAFELRVTLDTDGASDSDPGLNAGEYGFAPGMFSATMRFGSAMGSSLPGAPFAAFTGNDRTFAVPNPPPPFDNIELIVGDEGTPGFFGPSSVAVNTLFSAAAWGSDALPQTLSEGPSPDFNSNFSYSSYINFAGRIPSQIAGSITSFQIIPAPGAAAMFVAGALAVVRRRRR